MTDDRRPESNELPPNRFNAHAWIIGEPTIGSGCWIGAFTVIDGSGGLVIGDGCEVSSGAQIYTHSTVPRVISERAMETMRAPVTIGNHVHIGSGAIILMGSQIGHHSIVGAGAVVLQDTIVPPWSVVVGNPGRIIPDAARKWNSA